MAIWLGKRNRRFNVNLDSLEMARIRRRQIEKNRFLQEIYRYWYTSLAEVLPKGTRPVLEIGANGSKAKNYIPNLITSDILFDPSVDVILNGQSIPLRSGSLRGIVMTDVLHHLPSARDFFSEALRCLQPGGVIAMIEPWLTPWSRLIYRHLHPESCEPDCEAWEFESTGPMSGANAALPWILFHRDRAVFQREFPALVISRVDTDMPFTYILSGGVSGVPIMPAGTFRFWRRLEKGMSAVMGTWAMFAKIVLIKS